MKIINSLQNYFSSTKKVLTLGSFDGVHIGHQKIIKKIVSSSKLLSCESLVLVFYPHPKITLNHNCDIKLLNTINEKIALLQEIGVDNLVIQPFDKNFSNLSPEKFVEEVLIHKLNVKKIIIGHDHHFGKNRKANIKDLIQYGQKYNFDVEEVAAQEINNISVSSTKIREAISNGKIETATQYLGYYYLLTGTITKGKQLGRTIGFPTANLNIDENYKLIPKNGVYIVQSCIDKKNIFGLLNIGFNPTFNGTNLSIEVNFFDFNDDLYNKKISLEIISRIRDEQKFENIQMLKNQLNNDKIFALNYLKNKT